MTRSLRAAVLCVALVLAALPAAAETLTPDCTDDVDEAVPFSVDVDGEEATGHFALPEAAPTGMVTFAHGYGHTSASWTEHLRNAARDLGVIALAMDYRGTEIIPREGDVPTSRGWRVAEGAQDTITAATLFETTCPGLDTITNFGVSMGGNTSGLVAAAGATRSDGSPMFDYWINVEGATNVIETYLEARTLAPANTTAANAAADIEAEMGGTFEEVPEVYAERAVVTRAADIAASGVRNVIMVHGVDDGLVPPNQTREMASALRAEDVPTVVTTVSLRDEQTEKDTTITGYVAGQVDPDYRSPLAGHASERSTTHMVMVEALRTLETIHRYRSWLVCDGDWHWDAVTDMRTGICVAPQS
jgi:hypothetical protein